MESLFKKQKDFIDLVTQTMREQHDNLRRAVVRLEPEPNKAASSDGVSSRLVEADAKAPVETKRLT